MGDLDGFTFGGRSVDQIARGTDPYTREFDGINFRMREGFGVAARDPRAQFRVTGLTGDGAPTPAYWIEGIEVYDGYFRLTTKLSAHFEPGEGRIGVLVEPYLRDEGARAYLFAAGPTLVVAPALSYRILYGDLRADGPKPPLWTRHMAGVRELERDRRRQWRAR